jgi:pyruvate dehydrogenase E2 component (dihydrolipoamide acetyltransferase)
MPRLSDTMTEGAISTWHKHPGDAVAVGDVLVEIETDKAVMEYEAYQAGTLREILTDEGQTVDIGTTIALIDDGAGRPAPSRSAPEIETPDTESPDTESTAPTAATERSRPAPIGQAGASAPGTAHPAATVPDGIPALAAVPDIRLLASPLVRKIARENHLDLTGISGTGPGGRIIQADLSGLLAAGGTGGTRVAGPSVATAPNGTTSAATANGANGTAGPAAAPGPLAAPLTTTAPAAADSDDVRGSRTVPVSQIRRVIARRLSASASEIPHFYVTAAADAEDLMNLRATLNAQLTAAGRAKISVNDLLIRAVALALREHPEVNVSYGGDASPVMQMHDRINIGVAVAAESGLIVPVIRDADTKTVTQLGAETRNLVQLAADRKLTPAQTGGGTFTISNLGMYGVAEFTAIINPPEAAILAVGGTLREPTVVGDEIVPRYKLRYTLSADHRVIDGALAAQFLKTLTGLVEHPWMIVA